MNVRKNILVFAHKLNLIEANLRKTRFAEIYKKNLWRGEMSVSGTASDPSQTITLKNRLPEIFKSLNIKTLIDAPCGDFLWMKDIDYCLDSYTGIDIVPSLISENRKKYAKTGRSFLIQDIVNSSLPKVDLILCRDCFIHFSYIDILSSLDNFIKSKSTYLFTTTFTDIKKNNNIRTGDWRPLNLELYPFNFPKPIMIINENNTEVNGKFADKSLALWNIEILKKIVIN